MARPVAGKENVPMKSHLSLLLPAALTLLLAGCSGPTTPGGSDGKKMSGKPAVAGEDEIRLSLLKLTPADRKAAEAQRWCAVAGANRLGSMGAPDKVEVNGQTVFLCCKSCRKKALADPDKTLAKVKALKEKAAASP
jgi:hypothetical protein